MPYGQTYFILLSIKHFLRPVNSKGKNGKGDAMKQLQYIVGNSCRCSSVIMLHTGRVVPHVDISDRLLLPQYSGVLPLANAAFDFENRPFSPLITGNTANKLNTLGTIKPPPRADNAFQIHPLHASEQIPPRSCTTLVMLLSGACVTPIP